MLRFVISLFFSIILSTHVQAALNLVLTQGMNSAQPIAIVSFAGQGNNQMPDNIASVVTNDLQNSGRFKALASSQMTQFPHSAKEVDANYWRTANVDNVVVGNVNAMGGNQYRVNFALLDVFNTGSSQSQTLLSKEYTVNGNQLRSLAHHISDQIYQALTGEKGIFSTRIAYVLVQRTPNQPTRYVMEVADMDGFNPRPILTSLEPIMSPSWSHDGRQLAYVSFENKRAQIYVADVASGQRRVVSSFPGINGAPAWSPDGRKLALVLSQGNGPKIFVMDVGSGKLTQVTQGNSIDTEPGWSPDGDRLIFTSDRGGAPQIYQVSLADGKTQRITYDGEYNARASFTPDGKHIVMLHRENGMYNIAVQDLQSNTVDVLTSSGRDESPSIAPNGGMVIYGNEYGILGLVSLDGKVKLQLPSRDGKVQDPSWSPFLS